MFGTHHAVIAHEIDAARPTDARTRVHAVARGNKGAVVVAGEIQESQREGRLCDSSVVHGGDGQREGSVGALRSSRDHSRPLVQNQARRQRGPHGETVHVVGGVGRESDLLRHVVDGRDGVGEGGRRDTDAVRPAGDKRSILTHLVHRTRVAIAAFSIVHTLRLVDQRRAVDQAVPHRANDGDGNVLVAQRPKHADIQIHRLGDSDIHTQLSAGRVHGDSDRINRFLILGIEQGEVENGLG